MNSPLQTRPFPPYQQRQRQSERQTSSSLDKGHGRVERRTLTSTTSLNEYLNWPGVKQVCRICRQRTSQGKTSTETAYYVTSVGRGRADATTLLATARRYWGAIENGLHYVRDTTFAEDHCTIYRGHAPQNLAAFRNAALNWLRRFAVGNIAATIRSFTRKPLRLFAQLGYLE